VRIIRSLALLVIAMAVAGPARAATVPPETARYHDGPGHRYLLNGADWQMRRDGQKAWGRVSVPNAWNARDTSNKSMAGGVTWYRKDFVAPSGPAAAWLIHFDNVRYRATVWLNGRLVGSHAGAYLPWELRLRGMKRGGAANRLLVRVDNKTRPKDLPPARLTVEGAPNGGWWNYGGILGDVYLRRVDGLDFSRVQVRPSLPCRTCAAKVNYRVTVHNYSTRSAPVTVTGDYGGLGASLGTRTIGAGKETTFAGSLRIAQPHLWSPPDPYLYDVRLSAIGAGGAGTYQLYSGIRSIAVKHGRLLLNGGPVHFRGFFMHEDDPVQGGAVPHEREELFANLAKSAGATVLRTHYPFSPYMHELADRNGLMIWSEIPVYQVPTKILRDPGVRRLAARMLTDNITANGNHPSVMTWSIANELHARTTDVETSYIHAQAALARKLDPTRPVSMATQGYTSVGCRKAAYGPLQMLGLNSYFGWYQGANGELADRDNLSPALDYLHRCYPGKSLVVTEFGAEANRDGPDDERGTYGFQADLNDFHLRVYATKPWLGGAMGTLMTFKCRPHWDGGNPRPNPPYHDKGVFDYFGNPKPAASVVSQWYHQTVQYGP
jgi:beta-galactosidase/beta-glucuronidase